MRGNASKYPDKRESQVNAKARLLQILCGCTDQRLAYFTPDFLAATHNVPIRICEYELIIERQRRASRAAQG